MFDLIIVGAGAAGLATAIFAARAGVQRVVCLESAKKVGAKILVSGGGRCNVTNRVVTDRDFWGSTPRAIRNVLRAFPADRAASFFAAQGVSLHEEEDGKLFPDSNRARDIVDALLRAAAEARVDVRASCRVTEVRADPFEVLTDVGEALQARAVVLATGGRSLPKSGSDGFGYALARALGHSVVETTPALVPLNVDDAVCERLSGVAVTAEVSVRQGTRTTAKLAGPLLWTHFGISGPAALNASRHWLRAQVENGEESVELVLNLCPGETFESIERWLLVKQTERPKALIVTVIGERLPQAVAHAWTIRTHLDPGATMAHLGRDDRRRLARALVAAPIEVRGSRGYNYAEVTAGGIPLSEVDTATMESRRCKGLHLVGEIVDVDGRLGGFNFQWAWSSAWVAGQALGAKLARM